MKKPTLIASLITLGLALQLPSAYACPNQADDDESVNITIKALNDTEDYAVIHPNCSESKQAQQSPQKRHQAKEKATTPSNKEHKHS